MEELSQVPMFSLEDFVREEPAGGTQDAATDDHHRPADGGLTGSGEGQAAAAPLHFDSAGLAGPLPLHPLALVFPDATAEEDEALARNIVSNGLLEPIVVAGDPPRVVDGRRRQRACARAGITPVYHHLPAGIDPRDYVWARNGERRNLTKSQRAFIAAELFQFSGPGRPPAAGENSAMLQNFGHPTMERVAGETGISTRLLSDGCRVADKDGTATTALREAVKNGLATVSDASRDRVIKAPPEVQRRAVAMLRNGEARSVSAAVDRVMASMPGTGTGREPEPGTIAKFRDRVSLHTCSVTGLAQRLEPGSVDLIVSSTPQDSGPRVTSGLAALARRALAPEGLLAVAVFDTALLPRLTGRLAGGDIQWLMEMSMLFPCPVARSAEPNRVHLRRAALLLYGRPGARVEAEQDVIEVPASGAVTGDSAAALETALALAVGHLLSPGRTVCDPSLAGGSAVALAAMAAGCPYIGAHQDQASIDAALAALARHAPYVDGT